MENEKIIQRIKKVLELSKNNPSEEEAKAAALMAQKLLVQYHITLAEVEDIDLDKVDEIVEVRVTVPSKKWKYTLAKIVAENFRCKRFYYGKNLLVFYGHETDANVAAETFKYLFTYGDRKATYLRNHSHKPGMNDDVTGIYNSFVAGFCSGVSKSLGEQSVALMVVIPQDVEDNYNSMSKDFRTMNTRTRYRRNAEAYDSGVREGYNAVSERRLGA